jgi:hypothetical protein
MAVTVSVMLQFRFHVCNYKKYPISISMGDQLITGPHHLQRKKQAAASCGAYG